MVAVDETVEAHCISEVHMAPIQYLLLLADPSLVGPFFQT